MGAESPMHLVRSHRTDRRSKANPRRRRDHEILSRNRLKRRFPPAILPPGRPGSCEPHVDPYSEPGAQYLTRRALMTRHSSEQSSTPLDSFPAKEHVFNARI